jgi:hypothetical protein
VLDDDRLAYVVARLHLLVDSLGEDDRLGLVVSANQVRVLSDFSQPLSRPDLHDAVDELSVVMTPVAYELILQVIPGPGYRLGQMHGTNSAFTTMNQGLLYVTGSVWCWGANHDEQGGYGSTEASAIPLRVEGLDPVLEVACGERHTCALTVPGDVYCWGDNDAGQLGDGTEDDHRRPVRVHDVRGAVGIAAAGHYACAVLDDGKVRCWGSDPASRVEVELKS